MFNNFFEKLKTGLQKTKREFTDKIDSMLNGYMTIDEELYEELEEILITSDIGVETTLDIINRLKQRVKEKRINTPTDIYPCLEEVLIECMRAKDVNDTEATPQIILVIGVNGVGKTTSIGKMANMYKAQGKKVLLAAADTFRAAAIDQLQIWGKRAGVDVISHQEGADPAAVVFDAIQAAKARKVDVLICDTAGRLHNKKNLMEELGKINRVVDREFSEAKRETLLVLDATTGQNAISQAKQFMEVCPLTGIILTKLDGTAKGGVAISIKNTLNIPVKYIGVGEAIEDFQEFDAEGFVKALF